VRFPRKLLMGVAAVALPIGVLSTVVGTGAASAVGANATGSVTCTAVKGTVKFVPPLKAGGTASETSTVAISLSGCNASGSNVTSTNFTGKLSGTFTGSTNDCASLGQNGGTGATLTIKWKAKIGLSTVNNTGLAITGEDEALEPVSGDVGFATPSAVAGHNTATSSGSFPGAGSSQSFIYSKSTQGQVGAKCTGTGVASLAFDAGTVTIPSV